MSIFSLSNLCFRFRFLGLNRNIDRVRVSLDCHFATCLTVQYFRSYITEFIALFTRESWNDLCLRFLHSPRLAQIRGCRMIEIKFVLGDCVVGPNDRDQINGRYTLIPLRSWFLFSALIQPAHLERTP